MEKSAKTNNWIRSGIFSFFEKFSVLVFGFGSLILLLKILTKEEFGAWVLFLTIASFIEVGRIGILQNALVKYLSSAKEDEYAAITTASLVINIGLTIFLDIFLWVTAKPFSILWKTPTLELMLHLYIINNIVLIPFYQFSFIQQGNLDFRGIFWSSFSKQGSFFLFVLICFIFHIQTDIVKLSVVQIFTSLISVIVSYFLAKKYLRFSKKIDRNWINTLFNFGKYVFGTNILSMLFKSLDKMMLGVFVSPAAVAVYELAIRITNLAEVPTFSLAAVVFPHSAQKAASEGIHAIKNVYEKSVGLMLSVILPFIIFIMCFPKFVIWIIAGEKYYDTIPILRITLSFGLFIPFLVQFGTVIDSIGKPRLNFLFTLLTALISFACAYFFVRYFGIYGAAFSTLLAYAISTGLGLYYLHIKLNINPLNAFKYIPFYYKFGYNLIKSKLHFVEQKSSVL